MSVPSFIGSLIIIGAVFGISKLLKKNLDIENLKLGKIGFALVTLYMILLYASMWGFLLPEKIGTPLGIFMILISALVFLFLLFRLPGLKKIEFSAGKLETKDILGSWVLFTILSLVWVSIPEIISVIGLIPFLGVPVVGIGILLYTAVSAIKKR